MAVVRRSASSTAPIVVGGRTITMRARNWVVPLQFGDVEAFYARARPDHIEVLEPDGRHVTVRVHDYTFWARGAIVATTFATTATMRARRRRRRAA